MDRRLPQLLMNLVLGPPGHQRVRVSQNLLSMSIFIMYALMQHVAVELGLMDREASNTLAVFNLAGTFTFYLLIRSGLNLHCRSDPALTQYQIAYSLVAIAWAYAVTGPIRGVVIPILLLVILFGMFALTPRQATGQGAFGLMLMGAAMAWRGTTDPVRYDPYIEAFHFVSAAIVVGAVSALSIQLGRMRRRLSQQKKELREALERIQTLATRDALTGLLNRRAMLEALTHEAQRVQRGSGPMCLALIDLDHFKRINDTHGHAAGDRVLRGFADIACEELRATDVLSRWGGEEFMLLLPATGMAAARVCIERMRTRLAATPFDDIAPGLTATFSAGFAQCLGDADLEHAMERADQAMYKAKAEGRNRTLCLEGDAEAATAQDPDPVLP
jgi:diguanylate cyclase